MIVEGMTSVHIEKSDLTSYTEYVIREQLGESAKRISHLGGGSFGIAYSALITGGKQIVVKFLRAKDMLDREVYALRSLADKCPVKMPKILFVRKADERIQVDCYAMEYIEGKTALSSLRLILAGKNKRLEFANQVTGALYAIHCNKNDKFGDLLSPDCDSWLEYYRPFAKTILDKAEEYYSCGDLKKKIILAMRAAWEKFDIIFSEPVEEASLIHGDLNLANIMVNHGKLTAFIDPLNSMYADREYDLFQFDNMLKNRFHLRRTYIRKYGGSRYCDAKCAFYGLYNEVYCCIKSGVVVNAIMNPLIRNMYKQLQELNDINE